MKAPTNDHMRDWHFIVITDPTVVQRLIQKFPPKVSPERVDFIYEVVESGG
jgi:hypothetical protein